MCLLVESIKIESNSFQNIKLHNERMNNTRKELFGCTDNIDIEEKIALLDSLNKHLIYKLRVIYSTKIHELEFLVYQKRKIEKLKIVAADNIKYDFKFCDRKNIDTLFALKSNCDEILIVKNNLLTDTSFSNVALFDGQSWATPKLPLLKGIMREKLLNEKKIIEHNIKATELCNYQKISLINAMNDLGEIEIPIENIF